MKQVHDLIVNGASMGANVTSEPVLLDQVAVAAVQAVWTGAPEGTLKLQASCDVGSDLAGGGVTTWTDLANPQTLAGAAGNYMWHLPDIGYRWLRCVFTRTAGTGALTARFVGKGP
jgi:hypothetical protein